MQIMSGAPDRLPQGLYSKVARYRHKVFVEQLGWELRTQDGAELDQFDRPDTVYVVAQDDEGLCLRLRPVTPNYSPLSSGGGLSPASQWFAAAVLPGCLGAFALCGGGSQ